MPGKAARFLGVTSSAKPTAIDGLKAAGVVIGGTILSVLLAIWMRSQSISAPYWIALMDSGWLLAFIVSMRYTMLKGWPGRAQAIFVGGLLVTVSAIVVGTAWVTAR